MQKAGLLPPSNSPDKLYFSRFKPAMIDNITRFNMFIPSYNMADLYRKGRGVITGEMQLEEIFQYFEPVIQTSDTTMDVVELEEVLLQTAMR